MPGVEEGEERERGRATTDERDEMEVIKTKGRTTQRG
jgi:hypothetical protein